MPEAHSALTHSTQHKNRRTEAEDWWRQPTLLSQTTPGLSTAFSSLAAGQAGDENENENENESENENENENENEKRMCKVRSL